MKSVVLSGTILFLVLLAMAAAFGQAGVSGDETPHMADGRPDLSSNNCHEGNYAMQGVLESARLLESEHVSEKK